VFHLCASVAEIFARFAALRLCVKTGSVRALASWSEIPFSGAPHPSRLLTGTHLAGFGSGMPFLTIFTPRSRIFGAETGISMIETGISATKTGISVTETAISVTETAISMTETAISVAKTGISMTETGIRGANLHRHRRVDDGDVLHAGAHHHADRPDDGHGIPGAGARAGRQHRSKRLVHARLQHR